MTVFAPSHRCEASWPFFAPESGKGFKSSRNMWQVWQAETGVFDVKRQRGLFSERGVLPLVVEKDSALPFVVVQRVWQGRLVAGRAKLRGAVEVLHDRFAMAIEMGKDLAVGDFTSDWLVIFIDEYCGHAHDVAASAAGVDLLDGVADHAGDAVLVVGTFLRSGLS